MNEDQIIFHNETNKQTKTPKQTENEIKRKYEKEKKAKFIAGKS